MRLSCRLLSAPLIVLGLAQVAAAQPKVLILTGSVQQAWVDDTKKKLVATGAFAAVDQIAGEMVAPTVQQLKAYDGVLVYDDGGGFGNNAVTVGNNLATYWDGGGAVVTASFVNASIPLQGNFATGGYLLISAAGQDQPMDSLGKINEPQSPLVQGVTKFSCQSCYRSTGALAPGAIAVAEYASGKPLILRGKVKGRERVDLNFYPPSMDSRAEFWSGDGGVIMKNALLYSITGGNPVRGAPNPVVFPQTGTGATSAPATVTFTNTGMAQATISAIKLGGPQAAEFSLVRVPGLPLGLAAGATFTVDVAFAPLAAGDRSAILSATVGGQPGTADVGLTGKAVGANLTITPNPVNLGGSQIGIAVTKDVTVANSGGGKITITGVAVTQNPQEFSLQNLPNFPVSLGGGANFSFRVVGKPTMNGRRTGVVTISSNDPNTPTFGIPVEVSSGPPTLTLDAGSIAFGPVNLKATSPQQIVTLTNSGFSNLVVANLALGGANPGDFVLDKKMAVGTVLPGAGQPFGVAFAPTALGQRQATLTITSNDPMTPQKTITLLGNGTSATVAVMPMAIDFGNQKVGAKSMPKNLTVQNGGNGTLKILGLTFSSPAYLQASGPVAPFTVPGGGNVVLGLVCQPNMIGALAATVTLATDVGNAQVGLKCTGVSPKIAVTPNLIDFGPVPLMGMPKQVMVTFLNQGTDVLTINDVGIAGMDQGSFDVPNVPMQPFDIAPGKQVSFAVAYAPMQAAVETAELYFDSTDPLLKTGRIKLSGQGVEAGVSVDPPTVDWGNVALGERSAPRSVTISNTGGGPLTVAVEAPANAVFAVTPKGNLVIAAMQSAKLDLTFAPLVVGAVTSTMNLTPTGLPPVKVTLRGQGVGPSLGIAPAQIDFGPVAVGQRSEATVVGLKNGGASTLEIGTIATSNPAFVLDLSKASLSLGPGGLTTFTVAFVPQAGGALMGNLAVTLKGAASPAAQIPLVGSGVVPTNRKGRGCAIAAERGSDLALPLLLASLLGLALGGRLSRRRDFRL